MRDTCDTAKTTRKKYGFDKISSAVKNMTLYLLHSIFSKHIRLKNIRPLSVSRSRRWIQLMNWQTARGLALLILDFGNRETKLGKHNAFRFNLRITELKSIYLANVLIFPLCPIIFSWDMQ